ncbi:MAG: hypothetical protein V4649_18305 [Bacteroidota bacterium]
MRKLSFFSVAAIAVFGAFTVMQSCSKITKLHYDLPMQTGSVEVTIPPTSDTTTQREVGSGVNTFNIDSFIKANTAGALGINNISSVKLTSVKLTLLNGTDTRNFANFQKVYASFYTNTNTTPKIIELNNPDVTAYALELPVDPNEELKSYLTGNTFHYSVGGKLRRAITDSVKCKVEYKFNVTVNN